jgi:hypothetical protein
MQVIEFARRLDAKIAAERPGFPRGDRFEWDCVRHPVLGEPYLAGLLSEILSLLRRP